MLDIRLGKSPDPRISKEAEYTRNICRLMGDLFPKMIFDINHLSLEKKHQLLKELFHMRRLKEDMYYRCKTDMICSSTNESANRIIHNTENAERS
jgi:hypothetical protein